MRKLIALLTALTAAVASLATNTSPPVPATYTVSWQGAGGMGGIPGGSCLYLSPAPRADNNDGISISVRARDLRDVWWVRGVLRYDPQVIAYAGWTPGLWFGGDMDNPGHLVDPGWIGILEAIPGGEGITGSGDVVTFHFRPVRPGRTFITWTNSKVNTQRVAALGGMVTVRGP